MSTALLLWSLIGGVFFLSYGAYGCYCMGHRRKRDVVGWIVAVLLMLCGVAMFCNVGLQIHNILEKPIPAGLQ